MRVAVPSDAVLKVSDQSPCPRDGAPRGPCPSAGPSSRSGRPDVRRGGSALRWRASMQRSRAPWQSLGGQPRSPRARCRRRRRRPQPRRCRLRRPTGGACSEDGQAELSAQAHTTRVEAPARGHGREPDERRDDDELRDADARADRREREHAASSSVSAPEPSSVVGHEVSAQGRWSWAGPGSGGRRTGSALDGADALGFVPGARARHRADRARGRGRTRCVPAPGDHAARAGRRGGPTDEVRRFDAARPPTASALPRPPRRTARTPQRARSAPPIDTSLRRSARRDSRSAAPGSVASASTARSR